MTISKKPEASIFATAIPDLVRLHNMGVDSEEIARRVKTIHKFNGSSIGMSGPTVRRLLNATLGPASRWYPKNKVVPLGDINCPSCGCRIEISGQKKKPWTA